MGSKVIAIAITFSIILLFCLFVEFPTENNTNSGNNELNIYSDLDPSTEIRNFLKRSPILEERLILIDRNILKIYNDFLTRKTNESCIFCKVKKGTPITFALLYPTDSKLKESVLLPILKAWEIGFWVESIIISAPRKFLPYHTNLPIGFILQKGNGAVVIEILLLHEREGDFWWHGSLRQDAQSDRKLANLDLQNLRNYFVLNHEGAFDKFHFELVTIDKNKINVPKNITLILNESSQFIECNYEIADKFYKTYGRDTTPKSVQFTHKAGKILSTAKAVLDELRIPFWISSGTLLGYYRQCDIIPYSADVDIGIFIKDYNDKIVNEFKARKLKLIYQFNKPSEGLELSFMMDKVKLDVFFFYDGGDYYWNGGLRQNKDGSGTLYKYKFPKFTLCWTEFLEMEVRVPCQTEEYIKANYGSDWFKPNPNWSWYTSPHNVEIGRIWSKREMKDVFKISKT